MRKRTSLLIISLITALSVSQIVFADSQIAVTPGSTASAPAQTPGSSPASSPAPTPAATPKPTTSPAATPIPTVKPSATPADPLYTSLLLKNDTKNNLISQENQVCKDIKDQENINKSKISAINAKSKSYSSAYNKIIDDIKLLLNPIKEKEITYYILNKNKSTITDTASPANQEAGLYDKQISSLNTAVKAMRDSIKYISLESVQYQKKLEAAQKDIDKCNLSISELNKQIVADKLSKDNEWNNFCTAMVNNDLKSANESFDKMLKIKEDIIKNYKDILKYKKSIGELLTSVEG